MKRKITVRLICALMTIVTVFSCIAISSNAYSYTESGTGNRALNPSKSDFKAVKNSALTTYTVKITDSVSSARSVDIFHYEAPKKGYYMIYTTGSTDTYGKIYEENGVFKISYDQINSNDDSGSGTNFKMINYFDKYEDYYIGVRAFGSNTGAYELNIVPNKDEYYSSIGGVWTNNHYSWSAVNSKSYKTAEQVKEYYRMMRDIQTQTIIRNSYKTLGPIGTMQTLLSAGATVFTIVGMAVPIAAGVSATVDIGVALAEDILDSLYEDVDCYTEIMAELEDKCGCGYYMVNGSDIYYTPTNGICVTSSKNWYGKTVNSYEAYSGTLLYGEEYYEGSWAQ